MLKMSALRDVLKIGIEITTEKNKNHLLEKMLKKAMDISGCDAGTLYLCKDEHLEFKIMKTLSQSVSRGENGERIDLPPVEMKEENVCAYAAIHRQLVKISDVYKSREFDFSGPKKYDGITGYRTRSMLVIPMEDAEDRVIGVIQLINKMNGKGKIVSFSDDDAFVLRALGSMAAVSLTNMLYIDEIKLEMRSFVQAFATAVDERTPYNGTHTRKVIVYACMVAEQFNKRADEGRGDTRFDEARMEQLELAAGLHDIGKMVVPLSVMNKGTRLDEGIVRVFERLEHIALLYERDMLKGYVSEEQYLEKCEELERVKRAVEKIDVAEFLSDELLSQVDWVESLFYVGADGRRIGYLTPEEVDCLRIRKGTLTRNEREIMENHAQMTKTILRQVHFSEKYANAPKYAAEHHEFLDGSGYPNRLRGDEISLDTRILTAADIFDAMTCADRPYKKPIPRERALTILEEMVEEGKLDGLVVEVFREALVGVTENEIERRAMLFR